MEKRFKEIQDDTKEKNTLPTEGFGYGSDLIFVWDGTSYVVEKKKKGETDAK